MRKLSWIWKLAKLCRCYTQLYQYNDHLSSLGLDSPQPYEMDAIFNQAFISTIYGVDVRFTTLSPKLEEYVTCDAYMVIWV
jgi:hypothetical protein